MHTQTSPRRWQNFDALRLIAASAVVLSHSFLLSSAGYLEEPFVRLFGDGKDLGVFAVGVFFIISGFLITRSYARRASTRSYLVNRVMRIFPGLLVCTLFTAVVIAPMFSPSPVQTLLSGDTWQYVWRTVLLQPFGGSGFPVEMYDGPQGTMMLGTTWSLAPEFACYIGVLLLGAAGLLRLPVATLLVLVGLWTHRSWDLPVGNHLAWALVFFAAGSTLYFVHERGRPGRLVVTGSVLAFVITTAAGEPLVGLALFGSIGLVQLATSERIALPDLARAGDLSYGVYLYGWPGAAGRSRLVGADDHLVGDVPPGHAARTRCGMALVASRRGPSSGRCPTVSAVRVRDRLGHQSSARGAASALSSIEAAAPTAWRTPSA